MRIIPGAIWVSQSGDGFSGFFFVFSGTFLWKVVWFLAGVRAEMAHGGYSRSPTPTARGPRTINWPNQ